MDDTILVTVLVPHDAKDGVLSELARLPGAEPDNFGAAGIDGGGAFSTIIVSLTASTISAFVAIMIARIKSNSASVEVDEIKVKGIYPSEVEVTLGLLLEQRGKIGKPPK